MKHFAVDLEVAAGPVDMVVAMVRGAEALSARRMAVDDPRHWETCQDT
jgi:hypothetical protein